MKTSPPPKRVMLCGPTPTMAHATTAIGPCTTDVVAPISYPEGLTAYFHDPG